MMKNIRITSIQQGNTAKAKEEKRETKAEAAKKNAMNEKRDDAESFFRKHRNATPKEPIGEERAKLGAWRTLLIVLIAFLVGGAGSVLTKEYAFPWLLSKPQFAENAFLKKATEGTTIINTTREVVTETQENAVPAAIEKAAPSIVGIYKDEELLQSGMILTNDGLILVAGTTIEENGTYTVKTRKGNTHDATVIDRNSTLGLALLRVESENLPVVTLADTTMMMPGERVIAVRHEANAKQSVAVVPTYVMAMKSMALNEEAAGELLANTHETITVTSATLSFEFLITMNGDVAGVRSLATNGNAALEETPYMNVDGLRDIIAQATKSMKIGYPDMGLEGAIVTPELAKEKSLASDTGYLITTLDEDGPAKDAELAVNDIILEIDHTEIAPNTNIGEILRAYSAGDVLKLKVIRPLNDESGTTESIAVELILE